MPIYFQSLKKAASLFFKLRSFVEFLTRPIAISALAMSTAVSCLLSVTAAHAQDQYPGGPVNIYVGSNAGGITDITARLLAEPLAKALNQSVIVQNKPGANGSIAAEIVARAKPDGLSLIFQVSAFHVVTPLVVKQRWDPITDFEPVAQLLSAPTIIAVRTDAPFKTMPEMITYAKANPGKLTFAGAGSASMPTIAAVQFQQKTGTQLLDVPYKGAGGSAIIDLISGVVDVAFFSPPSLLPQIGSGKLRALAVTGSHRIAALPDVPTTKELGYPSIDSPYWFGIYAPAKTPKPIVDRLAAELKKIVESSFFKTTTELQGSRAEYMSPEQFAKFTKDELARWAIAVKKGDLKAD